jgi:hypothetical protein
VEPANDGDAGIAKRADYVVDPQDHVAWALDGAEEGQGPPLEQVEVAKGGYEGLFAQSLLDTRRIGSATRVEGT